MKKYILCVVATFLLMSNANTISAQYQNTTIYTPKNTSVKQPGVLLVRIILQLKKTM